MTEAAVDTGTAPAEAQQSAQPAQSSPWYGEVEPDTLSYLESKGWTKDEAPREIFKSYRNLEKVFHDTKGSPERVLMMPKDWENEAEVNEFHVKLGRPEDVHGYEIEVEEGDVITENFLNTAFKRGLSKDAVRDLISQTQQIASEMNEKQEAEYNDSIVRAKSEWERKQGMALEQSKAKIAEAEHKFPEIREMAEAIERKYGAEKYLDFCMRLGESLGEDRAVGIGDSDSSGFMNVEGARQELAQMKGDFEKMKAYSDMDHPQHKAIKSQMDRLYRMAYPE